ncbi:hypothetical protein ACEQ8H_002339 [Pleosporales sp. CAS-2024a]
MKMYAHRLNPWDIDDVDDAAPHDEELPDYDGDAAPAYDFVSPEEPMATLDLRAYNRKIQVLRPCGASEASSYRITTNSFRVFSKKAEMEVLYTSREMRQRGMAAIGFDKDGPIPWCPRAHFDYIDSDGTTTVYTMEAKNFADWAIVFGGRVYQWCVAMRPTALVLQEVASTLVIARFTYSECGTQAMRGAEVGQLSVFRNALSMETNGVDKIVCSMLVALTYLKKMGRVYRNKAEDARCSGSVMDAHMAAHRASSAGVSMV